MTLPAAGPGNSISLLQINDEVAPYGIPSYRTISSAVRNSNVVTVTTSTNHGYSTDDRIRITGLSGTNTFNRSAIAITVTSPSTFTYPAAGVDETATGSGSCYLGTVSLGTNYIYRLAKAGIPLPYNAGYSSMSSQPVR